MRSLMLSRGYYHHTHHVFTRSLYSIGALPDCVPAHAFDCDHRAGLRRFLFLPLLLPLLLLCVVSVSSLLLCIAGASTSLLALRISTQHFVNSMYLQKNLKMFLNKF